jgi:hypothetical protein
MGLSHLQREDELPAGRSRIGKAGMEEIGLVRHAGVTAMARDDAERNFVCRGDRL